MARELQPDIFGDFTPPEILAPPPMRSPSTPTQSIPEHPSQRLPWATDRHAPPSGFAVQEEDWRSMVALVDQLRKRMSELESEQTALQNRQNEIIQATKVRIERMMGACQRMDEAMKSFTSESSEKLSAMQVRLNERKLSDHKVQELVDRHTSMIQSYEVRLNGLQRIMSEQEMQLMNARAALEEAQRRRP